MLINASLQAIETVEEAYAWLGNSLGPEADDSFVVTMFSVRVSLAIVVFLPCLRTAMCLPRFACDNNKVLHPQQNANASSRLTATKSWRKSVAKLYLLLRKHATAASLKTGLQETTLIEHL